MNNFEKFPLLGDWLKNLIDRAIQINPNADDYNEGILQGYYEAISHILTQIKVLDMMEDLHDDYLANFNPDDLITGKAISAFDKNKPEQKIDN